MCTEAGRLCVQRSLVCKQVGCFLCTLYVLISEVDVLDLFFEQRKGLVGAVHVGFFYKKYDILNFSFMETLFIAFGYSKTLIDLMCSGTI